MKGLKCTTSNCIYNNAGHCEAGIINIDKNGVCKTKMKEKFNNIDNEYSKMEVANDFDYEDNEDVLIECNACHCIYNHDNICNAKLVTIQDGVAKTKCVTKKIDK